MSSSFDYLPAAARARSTVRALKAGEALFRQGDRTFAIFEVERGRLQLIRHVDDRDVVLHTARVGDIVAEASLFSPTYHCDAIATTDTVVRRHPKASLFAAFNQDPKAAQAFMGRLAREIMSLRTRLERRNIHGARDRVRHYLALNVGPDGRTVTLTGTVKDLAGELGLAHEALYRTLADMAADGEIERLRRAIRLKNMPYDLDHIAGVDNGLKEKKSRNRRGRSCLQSHGKPRSPA